MPAAADSQRRWVVPGVVFLVALALRLTNSAFLIAHDPLAGHWHPAFDMTAYHEWALEIARGGWLSRHLSAYNHCVIYPHTLAPLHFLFGPGIWVSAVWNALLSALACALTAVAAQRLAGNAAGLIAGALLATAAPAMYLDALTLPESLVTCLAALTLLALMAVAADPTRRRRWVALGLASALLTLGRGNGLVIFGVTWLGLALWQWRRRESGGPWRGPLLALIAFALLLSPTLMRNGIIGGRWVPVTSNGPSLFIMGNVADTTGLFHTSDIYQDTLDTLGWTGPRITQALAIVGRSWLEDPIGAIALEARKAALLVSDAEWPDNVSFALGRH